MKNGTPCPKCGSADIVRVPGGTGRKSGNIIVVGLTLFSAVPVTRYLCGACGYSEEWVESASDREKVRQVYER